MMTHVWTVLLVAPSIAHGRAEKNMLHYFFRVASFFSLSSVFFDPVKVTVCR